VFLFYRLELAVVCFCSTGCTCWSWSTAGLGGHPEEWH